MRAPTPLTLAPAVALLTFWAGAATGQEAPGLPGVEASRDTLESRLAYYEAAAGSRAYSAELRSRATERAATVRRRLVEGDFRDGDRVLLMVDGEEALSGTFVVADSRSLRLPNVGRVQLRGVLRSELESVLTQAVGSYLTNPQVRARTLVRISIFGDVGSPGFHSFPPGTPLTEVLMDVGGLTRSADVKDLRWQRGTEVLMEGEPLLQALNSGATLDELGMHAGDQIYVPSKPPVPFRQILAFVAGLGTVIYTIDRITR